MAKQRRVATPRRNKRKPSATRAVAERPKRGAALARSSVAGSRPPSTQKASEAPPAPPSHKPEYYEAIALYERGVQALQRHDYAGAAEQFRLVLDRYPDERELVDRARLYLRVCERETSRQPAGPKTPAERVYAATVALNAGDHATALEHLRRALDEDPDNDHAHYIMAVALSMRGRPDESLEHLRRAIDLNPDNRALARQDPDLESIRDYEGFKAILEAPPSSSARRKPARPRR